MVSREISSTKFHSISIERQTVLIPTGFCLEIPEGYFVEIRPRSGLSAKENILIPNSPGTVDSDYRGQVFVPLLNLSKAPFTVTCPWSKSKTSVAACSAAFSFDFIYGFNFSESLEEVTYCSILL